MDLEKCKEKIVFECIAGNGFLTKLRGHEFSKIQFEELFEALSYYRNCTQNTEMIEKEIVYSLYFLDLELMAALNSFSKSDVFREIQSSQTRCSEVIMDIFTPEKMKGNLLEHFI